MPLYTPRQMTLALAVIVLLAALPVLVTSASIGIADLYGCKVNEANDYPCVIGGIDVGGLLGSMFVMGWFALVTVPLGALALLGWMVVAIIQLVRRRATPT